MKSFLTVFIFILSLGLFVSTRSKEVIIPFEKIERIDTDSIKTKAFIVLDKKCNFCHNVQKPSYIFTEENMNAFVFTIKKQVFKKKKMPKGEGNELTAQESADLKAWVDRLIPED